MELLAIIALIVIIIFVTKAVIREKRNRRKVFKNNIYKYTPKKSLMTRSESEFFWKLNNIVHDRYFIFPQVHLTALLDHKVIGQEWNYAFRHINGKSVDYVLCNKTSLQPMYAVELDDPSHKQVDRIKRDIEVERIFEEANIPLVRFRDYEKLSEEDIVNTFADARKLADSKISS